MEQMLVLRMTGIVSLVMAAAMIPSLGYALFREWGMVLPFLGTIMIGLAFGVYALKSTVSQRKMRLSIRGGAMFLGSSWLYTSILGAFPYFASGDFSLPKALFESASALTTTGVSSVLEGAPYPASLLLWHDISQWLGGIGAIIIFAVIMPQLGSSAANLFSAEVQGNSAERTMPHIREAVRILIFLYLGMTAMMIFILLMLRQPLEMAVKLAATSISTSGYLHYRTYLMEVNDPNLELFLILFLIIGSCNFILYYRIFQKRMDVFWKDTERRWFFGLIIGISLLVTFNLWKNDCYDVFSSLRYAFFQVVSVMSTAGLATQDFSQWPAFSRLMLFYAAIIGGCSASTAGGVKVSRLVVLLKVCWQEIIRTLHPKMVRVIVMSGKPVPTQAIIGVGRYFFLYFIVFIALSMLYSLTGSDMLESMATIVVFLSNVGSAFGIMGEGTTFEALNGFGYLILYVTMIMGRIELFAFVMFLHPDFWAKRRGW
ncbi:MAG: TrkH family potassium uptake protein [Acidaminococcaceae bacterium]|nr:TrkH family potassium uptake protein [Acidaminococcaceae bacterium]